MNVVSLCTFLNVDLWCFFEPQLQDSFCQCTKMFEFVNPKVLISLLLPLHMPFLKTEVSNEPVMGVLVYGN